MNCSTCYIKAQGLDPEHKNCKPCFPGWEPIPEEKESLCVNCIHDYFKEPCGSSAIHSHETGKVINCDACEIRDCGNCGRHSFPKSPWISVTGKDVSIARCLLNGYITLINEKAGSLEPCQWKPIEPVCGECGGTGEVKNTPYVGMRAKWKRCPACSGSEKEKGLMVPARWETLKDRYPRHEVLRIGRNIIIGSYYWCGNNHWRAIAEGIVYEGKDENKAKLAVEKALGIERGEG